PFSYREIPRLPASPRDVSIDAQGPLRRSSVHQDGGTAHGPRPPVGARNPPPADDRSEITTMNSSSNEPSPAPGPAPSGIVIGRDLMFTAKVTGPAGELGYRMRVAGDVAAARRMIEEMQPRVILVDLAAGELATPSALGEYRRLAGESAWLVAVGP